jgi:hypothetical protein
VNKYELGRNCVTHHTACDCREARFREIEAERDSLAEQVKVLREALVDIDKATDEIECYVPRISENALAALEKADAIAGRK